MSAATRRRPSPAARIVRLIAIVLIFVLIGPPVGAVTLVAMAAGIGAHGELDATGLTWVTLLGLVYLVPASYLLGTVPAAAAGAAIGITQAFFGRAGWPMALGTGLIVAIVMLDRSGRILYAGTREDDPFPEYPAVLACLIPTMLCWALVRNWYFAPPSSMESTP